MISDDKFSYVNGSTSFVRYSEVIPDSYRILMPSYYMPASSQTDCTQVFSTF